MTLHVLRGLRPVDFIQSFKQFLRKCGLVDYPLLHVLADNRISATLGFAVDDFVVGKYGSEFFTPVNRHVDILCIAVQIKLFENPLGPFVKFRVRSGNHFAPVIIEAELTKLLGEGFDVFLRKSVGMVTGRYRILLCGQTEGIVSHGMKHVVSLHTFHSRNNIGCRIAFGMAGMKADA